MIKERHFNVHPDVLTCLLYLRLKSELSVRASDSRVDTEDKTRGRRTATKGKSTDHPYLSKKARKTLKEKKGIEREVREAGAEVDKEERAKTVSDGRASRFRCADKGGKAHGHPEASFCLVLPDTQKPPSDTSFAGGPEGYIQICASRQRRLLQGFDAGSQEPHHTRS